MLFCSWCVLLKDTSPGVCLLSWGFEPTVCSLVEGWVSLCPPAAKCDFSFCINTLISSHDSGESGGGISRDEYISQVAQDIQNKLPKVFDLDVIHKRFGLDVPPTSVVLLQELERFNKLVVRMRRSLAELQRVRRRV